MAELLPVIIARSRWLILRQAAGPFLSIAHAPALTRALRGALMRHSVQPPPEILSGHKPDGRPSEAGHAAFVALPGDSIGERERAIVAVAVVLPAGVPDEEADVITDAVAAWQRDGSSPVPRALGWAAAPSGALFLARGSEWWAERVEAPRFGGPPPALVGPSRWWSTALPIALDRFPGDLYAADPARAAKAAHRARDLVAVSCRRANLPAPVAVRLGPRANLPGIPDAAVFASLAARAGHAKQVLVHARIAFESPQGGPLILGRGRHFGLGLLVPTSKPCAHGPEPRAS